MPRISALIAFFFCLLAQGVWSDSTKQVNVRVGNFIHSLGNDDVLAVELKTINKQLIHSFENISRGHFTKFVNITNLYFDVQVLKPKNKTLGPVSLSVVHMNNPNSTDLVSINIYGQVEDLKLDVDRSDTVNNSNWPSCEIDQAALKLIHMGSYPLEYYEISGECYQCATNLLGTVNPGVTIFLCVDTRFEYQMLLSENENLSFWKNEFYEERGQYFLNITGEDKDHPNTIMYDFQKVKEGQNSFLPLLYVSIVLVLVALIYSVATFVEWKYRCCIRMKARLWTEMKFERDFGNPSRYGLKGSYSSTSISKHAQFGNKDGETSPLIGSETETLASGKRSKKHKERLQSLDGFRGLSLVIMIFVNYGGGGYWFLDHSSWNGLTVADLVFPWFVWIMGVSMVYSFKGRQKDSWFSKLYQILRRTVILFALGIFLDHQTNFSKMRIPGVLQRFAISYFVVAITEYLTIFLYSRFELQHKVFKHFKDLTNNWIQWIVTAALILTHTCITFLLPLDWNCPRGYLGPGGLAEFGKYPNCTGGAARKLDLMLFHESHIYQHPTCKTPYKCLAHDPEGALGALNSIVICFLGLQCGKILIYHKGHVHRIVRMIIWGLILGLIGAALAEFKQNGGAIPLNKNLWSLSFILVMAGTGYLLLAAFYFIIDVLKIWTGAPFIFPGMNSIFIYVGSELLDGYFPFFWDGPNCHLKRLFENLLAVSIWIIVAYYCYIIKFFVKI